MDTWDCASHLEQAILMLVTGLFIIVFSKSVIKFRPEQVAKACTDPP